MNPLLRQFFVVSSTLLAAISTGGIVGLPSVLLQQLKRNDSQIHIDLDTETWIASIHGLAGVPSVMIPYLMKCWGRRFGFRATCVSILIGWIILYFAKSTLTIIIAKLFQGAGVKSLFLVCLMTISEMVGPNIRNQSIVLYGVIQTIVVLFVHIAGNFVHWTTICLFMFFPLVLAIIFSYIWPESPAWLAYKGRFEESKKSFIWLRGETKESLAEMNALFKAQKQFLRADMSAEDLKRSKSQMSSVWRKISSRDFYLPIIHMFVLQSCFYWSGNLVIVVYAINIINKVIPDSEFAFIAMIIIDIAFIIGNVSSPILLKFTGNKPILLIGGMFSILFLLCSSCVLYLQKIDKVAENSSLCLYFLVGFMVCSSTAFYIIPFGVATEIIPLRHRGVVGSIYIVSMSISYTVSLKIAPYLIISVGVYGVFLLYAIILSFCLTWIWKFVPETKNKTLQSIEEHFIENCEDTSVIEEEADVTIDSEINEDMNLNVVK